MIRPYLFCFLFLVSGGSFAQDADKDLKTDNLIIEKVKSHVFRHVSYFKSEAFGRVPCNGMIVYDNGVEIGRVPVDGAGNWTFTPAPPLADGSHSFSSIVVDGAGNRSPQSTAVDFIVDTSAVAIKVRLKGWYFIHGYSGC